MHSVPAPRPPVRWRLWLWPVAVGALFVLIGLGAVWLFETPQRQTKVVATMVVGFFSLAVGLLWTVIWIFAYSQMRRSWRLGSLGTLAGLLLAWAIAVELHGFTGDVVPILGWRWADRAGAGSPLGTSRPSGDAAIASTGSRQDYPGFLGPAGDGTLRDGALAREWTEPPDLLWRRPVGAGWSGFAVAGEIAVTQEQHGPEERVTAYALTTGAPLWSHGLPVRWWDPIAGPGPRATPAIHDGTVFALGGTGVLRAIDLNTGEVRWTKDVVAENRATIPDYGVSTSPLILDRLVVVHAGGANGRSLVAYDAADGTLVWSGGNAGPSYGTPHRIRLAGREQIVLLTADSVAAHAPEDGRVLWEFPWPGSTEMATQPVVLPGDRIFASTGYGIGGKLLQIRPGAGGTFEVELLWESLGLKAKFSNVVFHDGFLYGLDDGILACVDPADGSRRWKGGRYGHGQFILVGETLLVLSEKGSVALVAATPDGFSELGRLDALRGKTWNHPALAGDILLVRNDREAAGFRLPRGSVEHG